MEKIMLFVKITGIWLYPFTYAVIRYSVFTFWGAITAISESGGDVPPGANIAIALLSLIPTLLILIKNIWAIIHDHIDINEIQFLPSRSVYATSSEKRKAMYPPIPQKYLSDHPEGILLGKKGKKYVRIKPDIRNIVQGLIVGSPGSGKSVMILNTLLANTLQHDPPLSAFVLDIKPELAEKSTDIYHDPNILIVNPTDRNSYGWDPLYRLNSGSSEDDILHEMDSISRALIVSSNPKDMFFVNNARTVFQGTMLYYICKGDSFINGITAILSHDTQALVSRILDDTEHCPKTSKAYAILCKYKDKTSEAMQDVELTLQEHLNIFLQDNIRWFIQDNPRKTSPEDFSRNKSIFLCMPEYTLDQLSDICRLVCFQLLQSIQRMPDGGTGKIHVLFLDELPRLQKIEVLPSTMALCRSKGVSCWVICQSLSQLQSAYSHEEARTILNLCEAICILSCKDVDSNKEFAAMVGEYREAKQSVNHNRDTSLLYSNYSSSEEYRPIVTPADIMTLKESGEEILFLDGKYLRVKKCAYYNDPILLRKQEEIRILNDSEASK